jgi:3',5'-cyclic AMP phosphodiesterase CpdA
MTTTFTLAHLSDVHLSPIFGFTPRHWNAKRLLGFANWQRRRRHVHHRGTADRLVADIKAQAVNHIAITGDLINIGLPAEYEAAAMWLRSVGEPDAVSLVPGNHDIYTHLGLDPGVGRWNAYMASDDWGIAQGASGLGAFPFVRRVGPIAIVGLCSAVPTAPGIATGEIGHEQMQALARILTQLGRDKIFRLVMIHHPPLPGQARPRHDLTDAAALAQLLREAGCELVLHGHIHRPVTAAFNHTGGRGHVIGAASVSASRSHGAEPLARYNLIDLAQSSDGWQIGVRQRGLDRTSGSIVELARAQLS